MGMQSLAQWGPDLKWGFEALPSWKYIHMYIHNKENCYSLEWPSFPVALPHIWSCMVNKANDKQRKSGPSWIIKHSRLGWVSCRDLTQGCCTQQEVQQGENRLLWRAKDGNKGDHDIPFSSVVFQRLAKGTCPSRESRMCDTMCSCCSCDVQGVRITQAVSCITSALSVTSARPIDLYLHPMRSPVRDQSHTGLYYPLSGGDGGLELLKNNFQVDSALCLLMNSLQKLKDSGQNHQETSCRQQKDSDRVLATLVQRGVAWILLTEKWLWLKSSSVFPKELNVSQGLVLSSYITHRTQHSQEILSHPQEEALNVQSIQLWRGHEGGIPPGVSSWASSFRTAVQSGQCFLGPGSGHCSTVAPFLFLVESLIIAGLLFGYPSLGGLTKFILLSISTGSW